MATIRQKVTFSPRQTRGDYRDIFAAVRWALSGKKILAQFIGVTLGYGGFVILHYVALLGAGESLKEIWLNFGLAPYVPPEARTWWVNTIVFFSYFWLVFAWLCASFLVSKMMLEELGGNIFYTLAESWSFLREQYKKIIYPFFFLFLFGGMLLLILVLAGLFSRIPIVGELGFAFGYLVPLFVLSAVFLFVAVGICIGIVLLPSVAAAEQKGVFEVIVHLYSLVWRQPWRWLFYTATTLVLAKLATFGFGYITYRGAGLVIDIASWVGGQKIELIFEQAYQYLPGDEPIVLFFSTLIPLVGVKSPVNLGFYIPFSGDTARLSLVQQVASGIIGLELIALFIMVVAYGLSIVSCGQVATYLAMHRKQDKTAELPGSQVQ